MEILVVILIVGALAGLALPRYTYSVEKATAAEALRILASLREAEIAYELENNSYATDPTALELTIPPSKNFDNPTFGGTSTSLASIVRKGSNNYTLRIEANGTIHCETDSNNMCNRLGLNP